MPPATHCENRDGENHCGSGGEQGDEWSTHRNRAIARGVQAARLVGRVSGAEHFFEFTACDDGRAEVHRQGAFVPLERGNTGGGCPAKSTPQAAP